VAWPLIQNETMFVAYTVSREAWPAFYRYWAHYGADLFEPTWHPVTLSGTARVPAEAVSRSRL